MLLAGDVGGTNIRLALFDQTPTGFTQLDSARFETARFSNLRGVVENFLSGKEQPDSGCIGVPGPVDQGRVKLTNVPWELSEHEMGLSSFRLVNDLVATAASLPFQSENDLAPLYAATEERKGPKVVIAPGTGLGHAFLIDHHGEQIPVSSEGGHALFAPANTEQGELREYLESRFGIASVERVLCGPGISNVFDFLNASFRYSISSELRDELSAPDADRAAIISRWALDRRAPICEHALEIFVDALAAHSGNVALTVLGTGGVYLGGGIPPKILPLLEDGRFAKEFLNKGKMAHVLEATSVSVIRDDRAALIGAASIAAEI